MAECIKLTKFWIKWKAVNIFNSLSLPVSKQAGIAWIYLGRLGEKN
jgi:hypothetical protein